MNPKSATFRQHYYPEGGWGWVICACAVVVQLLTTGLQFSFGILYLHVLRVYGESGVVATAWPGVLCLATSYGLTPVLAVFCSTFYLSTAQVLVAFCRRKSTRLTAVVGGLTMALAILFTSFAKELHQVTTLSTGLLFLQDTNQ